MMLKAKLIDKWNKLPITLKSSIAFSIAIFAQKGLQSLSTPIFTRLMEKSEYEVFTIYYAWSSIITIVATLNLASGVLNNQLVKEADSRHKIVSSLQGLGSLWSVCVLALFSVVTFCGVSVKGISNDIWYLMLISFIFYPALDLWLVSKRFFYEYKMPCVVMVIVSALMFVVPLVAVKLSPDKGTARVVFTIITNLCVGIVFWIINLKNGKTLFTGTIWKAALTFNLPLLPHFLALCLLNQMDKIMIERLCISGQAAIYSVAHTVAAIIQLLMTAINFSLVPWTYQRLKQGEYRDIAKKTNVILLCIGGMLCMLMLFAPEVMFIMAPSSYYEAVYIIPPMAAGIFFNYLYQLYSRIELYHESTKMMMLGSVITASLNFVLNYVFIKAYGYKAAAYTTLACYLFLCIMHGLMARYVVKKNKYSSKPYNTKGILIISFLVLAISFVMPTLFEHYIIRYLIISIFVIGVIIKRKRAVLLVKYIMNR